MDRLLRQCIEDMKVISSSGKYFLDAQVRAYDLLELILDICPGGSVSEEFRQAADSMCKVYAENASVLDSSFDATGLMDEASARLKPMEDACNEARFEAAAAASLHEFAKEVFEIWQNSGVFARRRALKELRKRAGFRLESHRIGNYVAKTFDLQNEATERYAKAQQTIYKANAVYKVKPGTYALIAERLSSFLSSDDGDA